jgi:hypothetical protein
MRARTDDMGGVASEWLITKLTLMSTRIDQVPRLAAQHAVPLHL